ncbi:hypothetical protein PFMG_00693 [Plasmodium falciparum IGH-CR14]|uniref:Uncharacterized protein n=4 Tax=Plasmodium falciparum TaxID=5833 RepID=C0H5I6_PLAF7|nr:conserved protein, unknown function [Plasmodium falciparum 3D7]KAF4326400.1 hypothetical protein CYL21_5362 [Plasmodium falciparum NF54]KNC35160.1 hypothetical protein PFLG_00078 [Plasmodium falciparum RAJ116]KNG74495.1 hypothetical protein PFMG_00693 [Plasmodium falciparum IGH-CR14]SOS80679.1 conserved Plasmodium protein, unknown function [Plasmodium sp. gorilla clade G1]PKC44698.1 hypothetical protein CK202_4519 [Plasmodium falciparum NF54]|eukprot:XP_002809083.1 conserved Plasmodium protein, unknown function [Plasmodium falciparum 3D7]
MPKFNFFPHVNFLAYIKKISIRYNPCGTYNDNCRKLIHLIENKQKKDKFLNLDYKLELIDYKDEPLIEIEMQNSKVFKFNPENYDLMEIQRVIDNEQQQLHHNFMKNNLLENNEDSFRL